jgi:HSP20 family protein
MEDLLRWDPFREMAPTAGATQMTFSPDFEILEAKDSYVFKADLPGVAENDVQISVTGNRLTISGKRDDEVKEERGNYYLYERCYGNFSRSFTLPQGTNMDAIKADLKDGVLTVAVPKSPESQPRKISLGATERNEKLPNTPDLKPGKTPPAKA